MSHGAKIFFVRQLFNRCRLLSALPPEELRRLVLEAVDPYVDRDILARQVAREEEQRGVLADFLNGWSGDSSVR